MSWQAVICGIGIVSYLAIIATIVLYCERKDSHDNTGRTK